MTDPTKKPAFSKAHQNLYQGLNEQGLYTKSYEEFAVQFSTPESQKNLYDAVVSQGFYTKSADDFYAQFFDVKKKEKAELPPQPVSAPASAMDSTVSTSDTAPQVPIESGDSASPTVTESEGRVFDDVTVEGTETQYLDGDFGELVNRMGSIGDVFDDMARAWGQGRATGDMVAIPYSIAVGDMTVSEDVIKQLVEDVNKYDDKMREIGQSDETQSFYATMDQNGGGAWGWLAATAKHPQAMGEVLLSSSSGMINTTSATNALAMLTGGTMAGATVGLAGGPLAPLTSSAGATIGAAASLPFAFGAAGATVEVASSFVDFLKEELGDKEFTYENVAPILMDESKLRELRKRSAVRGGTIFAVDAFGGAVLSKGAKAMKQAGRSALTTTGTTAVGEMATGFGGEMTAQVLSGQEPSVVEGLMEAGPGVVQTPFTLGSATIQDAMEGKPRPVEGRQEQQDVLDQLNTEAPKGEYKVNGGAVTRKALMELITDVTDEEMGSINIEISNDPEVQAMLEERGRKHQLSKDIPTEFSEQDRKLLVNLEYERQQLEGKTTATAKRRLKNVEAQIETINARYDEQVTASTEVVESPSVSEQLGRVVVMEDGTRGELRRDTEFGDRVVIETDERIIDLGNAAEVMDKPISELNLAEDQAGVEVTPDGTLIYNGNEYGIQRDIPTRGIEYDADGNVTRVSIKDAEGKTVMLEGQDAQDAAYQILLDQAQRPEQEQTVNEALAQDEEFQRDHDEYVRRKEQELAGQPTEAAPVAEEQAAQVSEQAPTQPAQEPISPVRAGPVESPQAHREALEKEGVWVKGKGLKNKAEGLRRRWFSARGFMPRSMFRDREQREANIAKSANVAQQHIREFNRLLKKFKGDEDVLLADFDDAMRGGEGLNRLPEGFAGLAQEMRNQIDKLSIELVNLGVVPDSQIDNVISNLGQYLTRSYEVFTNKNWKDQVGKEKITAAKNLIRERERAQAGKDYLDASKNPQGLDAEAYLESVVDGYIDKYLSPDDAKAFVTAASDSKNTNILKERKDIPKEIRALMGEYTDPAQNFAASVLKMTQTAESARFLNKVKENGKGVFLFDKPNGPYTTQIASENSEAMSPLNGLYTTPEIANEFNKAGDQMSSFMQTYMKAIGTVKWAKTIGSVATHSKNVVGNLGFMWANGHTDLTQMNTAYQALKADLAGGSKEWQARMNRYVGLGIVKQSAAVGEIRDMFKDANMDDALARRMNDKGLSLKDKALRKARVGARKVEDLYQAEDDFFKIVAFENESNRYSEAMFGKPPEQLNEQELAELDGYVSELVKNTYPTYSRVPEAVQMIRRFPIMGNFVSFQAESYRVAWNTMAQAKAEMASDNPKIRSIGAKRMAGVTTYVGMKNAVTGVAGSAVGAGIMGAAGELLDNEQEQQRQEDLRMFMAPWSQNSKIIPYDLQDGKFSYIDFSSSDPYGHFDKIGNAFMRGEDGIDSFATGLFTVIEPFVGEEILTRRLVNVSRNVNDYGKPIYNQESPQAQQIQDVMSYMYGVIEPGTITSLRKVYDSGADPAEIAGQLTGFKPYNVDVNKQFGFQMIKFKERMSDANSLKYSNENQAYEANQSIQEEMHKYAMAANRLGVSKSEIIATMRQYARVSERQAEGIFAGVYKPLTPPRP